MLATNTRIPYGFDRTPIKISYRRGLSAEAAQTILSTTFYWKYSATNMNDPFNDKYNKNNDKKHEDMNEAS